MNTQQQPLLVPSQIQLDTFARGLLATIALWSAYQIALKESARSDETPQQTTMRLATELLDAFLAPYSTSGNPRMPDPSELSAFLNEFVDVELDTMLEDDSERGVASDVSNLWRNCCLAAKDVVPDSAKETVDKLVALAEQRKGVKIQITQDLAEDSDSGSVSDEEEAPFNPASIVEMDLDDSQSTTTNAQSQEQDSGYASNSPIRTKHKVEPMVDDDGFTTVQHSKKARMH